MPYDEEIAEFVAEHCVGKQYDSCHDSPCRYASAHGCQHPLHPKNFGDTLRRWALDAGADRQARRAED